MSEFLPRRRRPGLASPWILGYAALLLGVWALIAGLGDRWLPATLLLFAPRWALLAPLIPLGAFSVWRGRRLDPWIVAGSALLVLGPLMGLRAPIGHLFWGRPSGDRVRVLTLNLGTDPIDVAKLIDLIERERIDLIFFQEWRTEQHQLDGLDAYLSLGWHRDRSRMIACRWPMTGEGEYSGKHLQERGFYSLKLVAAEIRMPSGAAFHAVATHLPTMRWGFESLSAGDYAKARRFLDWRREQFLILAEKLADTGDLPLLIGGDLNTPPDSPLMGPLLARYRSAFDDAGWGYGFTRPSGLPWARIDAILGSAHWKFAGCRVGPDVRSDHLPVLAEAILTPP